MALWSPLYTSTPTLYGAHTKIQYSVPWRITLAIAAIFDMELELEWKLGDPSKRLNGRSMAADRTVASCYRVRSTSSSEIRARALC